MSKDKDGNDRAQPEVTEKAGRRRFTAEYKARILEAADRCTEPGQRSARLSDYNGANQAARMVSRMRVEGHEASFASPTIGSSASRRY